MNILRVLLCSFGVLLVMANMGVAADINRVVLAVHGGLGRARQDLSKEKETEVRNAFQQALAAGYKELDSTNGESIRAVAAAIKVLEDSPLFNAGKGAVYTSAKTIELDAAVMEGKERRAGAVAAVKRIRNPIEAAKAVMEKSPYVLLVGTDADKFAQDRGLQMVDQEYFETPYRLKEYEKLKAKKRSSNGNAGADDDAENRGTVGAVAIDHAGNLAAGTSTGGLAFKSPGRVGDSAIIGAGTYADNRACAVSATGDGEFFMRTCAAYDVSARMRYKRSTVTESSSQVIRGIRQMGGEGGLIALDHDGHLAMPYAADGMYRGFIDRNGDIQIHLYDE